MEQPHRLKGTRKDLPPVYWTGQTLDSWPEYLRDVSRAHELPREQAQAFAREFNRRTKLIRWMADPVADLESA